jgi:hypothetical protein
MHAHACCTATTALFWAVYWVVLHLQALYILSLQDAVQILAPLKHYY